MLIQKLKHLLLAVILGMGALALVPLIMVTIYVGFYILLAVGLCLIAVFLYHCFQQEARLKSNKGV